MKQITLISTMLLLLVVAGYSQNCQAGFVFSTTPGNPYLVQFYDSSSGSGQIVSYSWDFGNGSTSSQANPTNAYNGNGIYGICLTVVFNDNGIACTSTYCDSINIGGSTGGGCSSSFTSQSSTTALGMTTSFTVSSQGTAPYSYSWDFGDGTTGTGSNQSHTYSQAGYYIVCLTATDASGCTSTYCDSAGTSGNPGGGNCYVDYVATSSTTPAGTNTVAFTTRPQGTAPFTYSWDFGDNSTGTGANPTHSYNVQGYFIACVTLTDATGCTSTYCDSVGASGNPGGGCSASFFAQSSPTGAGSSVTFSATPQGTAPFTYLWDLGDGSTATGATVVHTYSPAGYYGACLTITDATGCTSTYCDTVGTSGNPSGNCYADFVATTTAGSTAVSFTARAQGTAPFTYAWDFGDNTSGTGANPTHSYNTAGYVLACLTVTDATGCTSTYCDSVGGPGNPSGGCSSSFYAFEDSSAIGGSATTFVSQTQGTPPFTYLWDFGDGTTSTQANPIYAYPAPGYYIACLTVTDAAGCTSTSCDSIGSGVILNAAPGSITGVITQGINKAPGDPIEGVLVKISDLSGNQIGDTYSDINGIYTFDDLLYGSYVLVAEFNGSISDPLTVSIIPGTEDIVDIDIRLDRTTGIDDIANSNLQEAVLFPNPVQNATTVRLSLNEAAATQIRVSTVLGKQVHLQSLQLNSGQQDINLNLSELSAGLYLLDIQIDGQYATSLSIIKQ